jgi:hypothetical protein
MAGGHRWRGNLRHRAASLAHQAGADLKTPQDLLGHSSIVVTADTYTSMLPQAQRRCANATAKLVLAAARRTRDKIRTNAATNRPGPHPATGAPTPSRPTPWIQERRDEQPARSLMTPGWHPRDTRRPYWTDHVETAIKQNTRPAAC